MTYKCRWHSLPDPETLQSAAVEAILSAAKMAIRERGEFRFVLAGGNTPRRIYQALPAAKTDWNAWHIYFGDERCVSPDDPQRNSRMATEAWLNRVPIPPLQIHAIPGEKGASLAASIYAESLRKLGDFDLVLLGLGEDGHTASLFPGHDWGACPESPDALAVFDAPKPPVERVSMSASRLSRARKVIFLVCGESKRDALAGWRSGKDIPARAIRPLTGVDVLVESALLDPLPSTRLRFRQKHAGG